MHPNKFRLTLKVVEWVQVVIESLGFPNKHESLTLVAHSILEVKLEQLLVSLRILHLDVEN